MVAVRRRGALVVTTTVLGAVLGTGLGAVPGCRGETREQAAAPVDEKLAWPALDEPSLAAALAAELELGVPQPLAITPDGAVLFRRSKPRDPGADLYQLDAAGKTTVLATAAALLGTPAQAGSAPAGIDTIEVSADGARVLVPLAGRLFVIERASAAARELAIGPHRDPRLSPDGKHVAFVRDGDLWVVAIDAAAARPLRLTRHPPDREYATPELVARELGRRDGFWWSPDSQSIAFQRTDARAVDTLYLADPRQPFYPAGQAPAAVKFPRSGTANAVVDLGIVSLRGGAPRWVTWDLAHYAYLARVVWPAKGPLTLIVIGREQTVMSAVAVDPATSATRTLLVEKDPAWLDIAPEPLTWLPDGSGFLWMTESPGAWALEHRAADGSGARQILTADAGLRRVVAISPDGSEVIVEAAGSAREQGVWRVAIAGGHAPTAVTPQGGVHRALGGHGLIAIRSLHRAGGGVTQVLRADGTRVELPSVAERPKAAVTTKLEEIIAEDHAQFAAVTRPHAFDAKVRYPVVLRIGGPGQTVVLDAMDAYLVDQWWADAGFIVVRTDGRGTPHSDRSWERAIAGDVLTIPINDEIVAVKKLGARYPELDVGRVGALGAGIGGYLATMGALIHPDAFAAAVAVSPITDWALLDTAYSERYLKTPALNPEGYRRANAASYAEQLTRPLLILAGPSDDRVVFAHAIALIDALSAAGKSAELATLPAVVDPMREVASVKLELAFLREHLGPPVRPAVMPKARSEEDEEEEERERRSGGDKDRGDKDRGDKDRK